jgi:hypothetical protein
MDDEGRITDADLRDRRVIEVAINIELELLER